MNDKKNYLRIFGVHKVKITEVKKSEWKGVTSLVVTLQDAEGRLIDSKFKLPFAQNQISENQYKSLLKATGAKEPKELLNKELVVLVSPSFYMDEKTGKEKTFWNPSKFMSIATAHFIGKSEDEAALEDLGDPLGLGVSSDDLGDIKF